MLMYVYVICKFIFICISTLRLYTCMLQLSPFVSALRNGAKLLERRDDDGFDRLSNRYTVGK